MLPSTFKGPVRVSPGLWFDEKDGGGFSAPGLIAPNVARS